eukprot:7172419-Lingulodinium_polyedra.AAC.1
MMRRRVCNLPAMRVRSQVPICGEALSRRARRPEEVEADGARFLQGQGCCFHAFCDARLAICWLL